MKLSLETGGKALHMLAAPIRTDEDCAPARLGPELGADTAAILGEIGIGETELAALRADGIA